MEILQLIRRIEDVRDRFHAAVHQHGDLDAALALAEPDATLTHLPMGTGTAPGRDLREHLARDVLPHLPADLAFRRLSRTVDQRRLVEESVVTFTHDRELPWLLPGVAPTHRRAEVLAVTTVAVQHRSRAGRVGTLLRDQRVLWDLATLLTQLRLPLPAEPS